MMVRQMAAIARKRASRSSTISPVPDPAIVAIDPSADIFAQTSSSFERAPVYRTRRKTAAKKPSVS
jgi:hypothetical protein